MKIDLRTIPDAEVSGIDLMDVDITLPAPEAEPQRQYYFMALLKQQLVPERAKKNGKEFLTACITTFGCQMNARDSEKLEGILETVGYHIVETEDADFVVYNTCTVRENANLRVYGRLGQLGKYKKKNPGMIISLCGCMMQEPLVVEKLKKSYHFVNLIFGTHNIYRFAEYLVRCMTEDRMVIDIWKDTDKIVENLPVDRKYPFKSGVNIMFGCNNFCSYCIVPYVRGRERSREPDCVIEEVRSLVAEGYKDITLLGQNVNSYGKDLGTGYDFADLLTALDEIPGDYLIRFMSSQPKDASFKLFDTMARCSHVAKQLHLPVQSGSDRVLRAMNRPYDKARYLELITYARKVMPELVLTSDVIIGFPGETEAEAMETVALVEQVRFDALFTFIFSPRPGTPAAKMDDPVPRAEKQVWFDRLCDAQNKISEEIHAQYVGRTLRCLIDGQSDDSRWPLTARTAGGRLVHLVGDASAIGNYHDVKITDSNTWALFGEMV